MASQESVTKDELHSEKKEEEIIYEKETKGQEEFWLKDTSDVKADEELAKHDDDHYFNADETDLAIVNEIAITEDTPNVPIITARAIVVGVILSILSSSVYQLMSFKPAGSSLNNSFLLIVAYVLCDAWARYLPQGGWLNPGPFNFKEHTFVYIMFATANDSAYGTNVLSTQQLYFNRTPGVAGSIFFLFSTQLIGYGIAGQLRSFMIYPASVIWPSTLPTVSVLSTFCKNSTEAKWRTKFFFITFGVIFVYEFIPLYMWPLLSGFSIVCLASRNSQVVQNLFGGVDPNEGLGFLNLCFDWNRLNMAAPLTYPWWVQANSLIGIGLLYLLAPIIYYCNVWNAQSFPFLSNSIFRLFDNGTADYYPQDQVITAENTLNETALAEIGPPVYSPVYALSYVFLNAGMSSIITHVILFYGKDIWKSFLVAKSNMKSDNLDVHMREMKKYPEVPDWWYYVIYVVALGVSIGVSYANNSGFPWWGTIFAVLLSSILSLPLNMITAITGSSIGLNVFTEMIAGFILHGQPISNMYFKTLGFNTLYQAGGLARDLKIGHYMKIPPRITLASQFAGTIIGAIFNYIINKVIIETRGEDLLVPGGTKFWSGVSGPQTMNSAAMTWGAIGPANMFGIQTRYSIILWAFLIGLFLPIPFWLLHKKYPKIGFEYINVPIILANACVLPGGTSSYLWCSYLIAYISQYYLKRRYTDWFAKHNYLLSAALDSGTSIMVFILSMAVQGGANGESYNFPTWWGNRLDLPHTDYCCADC
ncbi:hypothetical protein CU097_011933 [Rhizopus azygosporus]|uniref:OPT family small oligopeptide transporter n=1 Tax=Rhizopus azygosporus TaxID=86630 RepID=A0A367JTE2_RHIAZ|nr:hypothetical protein CU097_011933 [Rhizopus azygosporus]